MVCSEKTQTSTVAPPKVRRAGGLGLSPHRAERYLHAVPRPRHRGFCRF